MSLIVDKCLQVWTYSFRHMNLKGDFVLFGDSLS